MLPDEKRLNQDTLNDKLCHRNKKQPGIIGLYNLVFPETMEKDINKKCLCQAFLFSI